MKSQELATSSIVSAVTDFNQYLFKHPKALIAFQELMTALSAEASPQVVIFTGPTGVGKSTLLRAACNQLIKQNLDRMKGEPDYVPLVSLSAVPPNGSSFSWKDFYIRLLSAQNEPLIDRKLLMPRQASSLPDHPFSEGKLERSVADALRRGVEDYCRNRRTKYLVIDEAHHMLLVNGPQRLECQFECLKSLTIQTGVTILLSGTYRLLDILEQSGQLTRRSHVVHFPRYDLRQSADRQGFRQILANLEKKLSEYIPTQLDVDYFYPKSAGCVGVLKDGLSRTFEFALRENIKTIDANLFERFALSNRRLKTIAEEAFIGESRLMDIGDDQLMDLLTKGILLDGLDSLGHKKPRQPGQRNPKRDPVGEVRSCRL